METAQDTANKEEISVNGNDVVLRSCNETMADGIEPTASSVATVESSPCPAKRIFRVRTSKYRHLNGCVSNKDNHITNITSLCKTIPSECNGFKVNEKFALIPIGPNGNQLAVIDVTNGGRRLGGGVMPCLNCGSSSICDYTFDPFSTRSIAIGCDNGTIKVFIVPEIGLTESIDDPEFEIDAHRDRISIVKYHPTAQSILSSCALDHKITIWDLDKKQQLICLDGHADPIFDFEWSPNGSLVATLCKDQKLRIYDPRNENNAPIKIGDGTMGARGGRVCWAQNGQQVIACGFSRVSERQVMVYDSGDLKNPLSIESIDVNPAILIPHYDEDSSTLFLTSRGDAAIYAFEVSSLEEGPPYIHPLSHYKCANPHQALAFLPKKCCDVRSVEFAKGFRLTTTSIEPISFTVPRLRKEYFQDDLFPQTKTTWVPTVTAKEWLAGSDGEYQYLDMKPQDMNNLSEAPPPKPTKRQETNRESGFVLDYERDISLESSLAAMHFGRAKQEQLAQSISNKVAYSQDSLPQESFDGVDSDEWDEV